MNMLNRTADPHRKAACSSALNDVIDLSRLSVCNFRTCDKATND